MRRRLVHGLLLVALAMQTLGLMPMAFASSVEADQDAAHCAGHMVDDGEQNCACCPDGVMMVGDCMTLCAAFVVGNALNILVATSTDPVASGIAAPHPSRTYAPPNPPPIR
jgi:hypothetical protein